MELRFYSFINFYLSPIQQGIQTAHLVHEMFNKYPIRTSAGVMDTASSDYSLYEWSENHKTIIVLNAGVDADIQELFDAFATLDEFPFVEFREDAGLCHARTGVGIVLPETIFNARWVPDAYALSNGYYAYYPENYLTKPETIVRYDATHKYWDLIRLVKSKRLA